MSQESLKNKTIINVLWNFAEKFLNRGLTVIVTLILAWLLTPEDFGLIAMLAIFIDLSFILVAGGLLTAIIRDKDITETDLNTAFYANLSFAVIIYALLYFSAPYIADFYKQQMLVEMIRVAGTVVFFQSLNVVQQAILQREIKFKLQLKVTIPASIITGVVTVILAYLGYGVWALVFQIVVAGILTTFFYWRLNIWRPGFEFCFKSFRKLFSFGIYVMGDDLAKALFSKVYIIVIAQFFSVSITGLYYFAEKIKWMLVLLLVNTVKQVSFPVLSKLQDDSKKMHQAFHKVVMLATFIIFPILLGLAAFAELFFQIFLPDKWFGAAVYLQLMAIEALLVPVQTFTSNILLAKGYSKHVFKLSLVGGFLVVGFLALTLQYGIEAVILGQIAVKILMTLYILRVTSNLLGYSIMSQMMSFLPNLVIGMAIFIVIYMLIQITQLSPIIELLVFSLLSLVLYFSIFRFFKVKSYIYFVEVLSSRKKKVQAEN